MEQQILNFGAGVLLAGVDEAGRGPLAGPVVAAAVILDPENPLDGLTDSKALSPARRRRLEQLIVEHSLAWAVARAEPHEIDELNILQASLLAMSRAVHALGVEPGHVLVDGNTCPKLAVPVDSVVKGDRLVPCISAASILAKEARDREMQELDADYPEYGFARHKGYPTAVHLQALERHGPCPVHRRSYGPVRRVLVGE